MRGVCGSSVLGCSEGDDSRLVNFYCVPLVTDAPVAFDGVSVAVQHQRTAGFNGDGTDNPPVLCAFFRGTLDDEVGMADWEENPPQPLCVGDWVSNVSPTDDRNDDASRTTHTSGRRSLQEPVVFPHIPRWPNVTARRREMHTHSSSPLFSSCDVKAFVSRPSGCKNILSRPLTHFAYMPLKTRESDSPVSSCVGCTEPLERIRSEAASLGESLRKSRSHVYGILPMPHEKRKVELPERTVSLANEEATAVSLMRESNMGVPPAFRSDKASTLTFVGSSLDCRLYGETRDENRGSALPLRGQRLRDAWRHDPTLPEHLHRVADIEGAGSVRLSRLIIVLCLRHYLDWSEEEVKRTVAGLANYLRETPDVGEVTLPTTNSRTLTVIREEDGTFYLNAGAFLLLMQALLLL
ncbi:hypothetical protein TraAM80_07457 [Trypanosoma rangeli]|uniref:Uncharacterized protein n=1 Tax=Trypanosoma rangeli TaxID=5698 RepID=A0A422N5E0_TRYRA|nr:uncharacterized protein TraAM80_07457 [Trypanosoma rangeli]RNF00684.1 hypothetical protein TraAM80_07457 [Trypanosoma rangeli]|eukprot:RNF00684.1 hypothetical protein TraAM80_07457 [Trypanosoma rangeli]